MMKTTAAEATQVPATPGTPTRLNAPIVQLFAAIDDVDDDGDGRELETHPFTSDGWSGGPLFFW
jgi:hypothetical protein